MGSSISSKKQTNEFVFTSMWIFLVWFLEEITKKHFEITWRLSPEEILTKFSAKTS